MQNRFFSVSNRGTKSGTLQNYPDVHGPLLYTFGPRTTVTCGFFQTMKKNVFNLRKLELIVLNGSDKFGIRI